MTSVETTIQKQQEKNERKLAKKANRKLAKSMKVLMINSYKRALRTRTYGKQRDELIDFIVNYPLNALRMNVKFIPLKEHKHLSFAA